MLQVFRIEYIMLRTNETWKTSIVAYSRSEAERLIMSLVKSPIRVTSYESMTNVDGIADDVVNMIINRYKLQVRAEVEEEVRQELSEKKTAEKAPKKAPKEKAKKAPEKRAIRRKKK